LFLEHSRLFRSFSDYFVSFLRFRFDNKWLKPSRSQKFINSNQNAYNNKIHPNHTINLQTTLINLHQKVNKKNALCTCSKLRDVNYEWRKWENKEEKDCVFIRWGASNTCKLTYIILCISSLFLDVYNIHACIYTKMFSLTLHWIMLEMLRRPQKNKFWY